MKSTVSANKKTTDETVVLREVIQGLKLHVSKIGVYPNDVVKQALCEDIDQLKNVIEPTKSELKKNDVPIWRRFEIVNKETLTEAESLVERKQLDRQELELLLITFRVLNT